MIYENLSIDKKYIKLKDIRISFEKNGIYIIAGENGSGKTTLIEQLVFDKDASHFVFADDSMLETFRNNKESLFTYISQKTLYSEDPVKKYIKKLNKQIKTKEISYYLDIFELPQDILKTKFCYLSGGEQKKINIISAFLKKTQYIFMDEPTNYMDDRAVGVLKTVLKQEGKNRKIIIVTHDPRLLEIHNCKLFLLEDSTIKQVLNNEADEEPCDEDNVICASKITCPGFIRLFLGEFKNSAFGITCFVFMSLMIGLLQYTNMAFMESIGEETGNYHDSILAYNVGGGHDPLNKMYEKAANIEVDENDYDHYINYDEIVNIANMDYVKEVYLPDMEYVYELETEETSAMKIFACPNVYTEQYNKTFQDEFDLKYTEGRLPEDNMNEVAISKNLLEKKYGYDEDSVEDAIGDRIAVGDSLYTIVGFSYYDIVILSYNPEENYGFYCYQKDTFKEFYDRQMEFIKEIDGGDDVNDILISVDEKNEKKVLDTLIKEYPSNCYISRKFEELFYQQQKKDVFKKWFLLNCFFSVLFAVVIWCIINKSIKYNMNIVYDYGNYYANRKKFVHNYIIMQLGCYVLISIIIIIINTISSEYSAMTNWYVLTDCLIMEVPVGIALKRGFSEVNL